MACQLYLARAYAQQNDAAKHAPVYQDFLALWKDADPISQSSKKPR